MTEQNKKSPGRPRKQNKDISVGQGASIPKNEPDLNISISVGDNSDLIDQIVSINPKKDPIFKVGDIHLTVQRYWAKVSKDMPEHYYNVIRKALELGYVVKGKNQVPGRDLDLDVLDHYWRLIDQGGNSPIVKDQIKNLIKLGKDGKKGGYHFWEILDYCKKKEQSTVARPEVIKMLDAALEFKETDFRELRVYHEEEGKVEIDLSKIGRDKDGAPTVASPPPGHKDLGISSDEALNKVFGG